MQRAVGRAWRRSGVVLAVLAVGCGAEPFTASGPPGALIPQFPAMLHPGVAVDLSLLSPDGNATVELSKGALPQGLELTPEGRLVGTPSLPGELARFAVITRSATLGEPLERRDYLAVVGVETTTLPAPPAALRLDDALYFHHDWGVTLSRAFAWDPVLSLAWPMRVGAGFSGSALAPAGGSLSVVVAGPRVQGHYVLQQDAFDERTQVIAQLTWAGEVDLDLHVLPPVAMAAEELSAASPELVLDGQWVMRRTLAETAAPGPEVVSFAKELPPGRWALVATKASGAAVDVPVWLSVRRRDGLILAERRIDALLSDVSSGLASADVQAGTQSYRCLGVLEIGVDREVSFHYVDGPAPFGVEDEVARR